MKALATVYPIKRSKVTARKAIELPLNCFIEWDTTKETEELSVSLEDEEEELGEREEELESDEF